MTLEKMVRKTVWFLLMQIDRHSHVLCFNDLWLLHVDFKTIWFLDFIVCLFVLC